MGVRWGSVAAILKSLTASTYVRAIATLSGGQALATIVPLLAAPILGRLYLPADYGALGIYMAIAGTLAPLATFQIQQGILAETSERRAEQLLAVCAWLSAAAAAVTAAALLIYLSATGRHGILAESWMWLLFLPATVLTGGLTAAITMLANRRRHYGFMAGNQVLSVTVTTLTSMVLGYLGWGASGLFVAYFLGQALALVQQFRLLTRIVERFPSVGWIQGRALLARHRAFALFSLPSELISGVNMNLPIYALSFVGAVPQIGAFSRARQLVMMPMSLLAASVGQVFRQRAAEDLRTKGNCRDIFRKTALALFALGLPPLIMLMIFAPDLFRIYLGPNWTEAGHIVQILTPMFLLRFVVSPLAAIFYFSGHQKLDFILSIAAALALGAGTLVPAFSGASVSTIIAGYSAAYCAVYAAYFAAAWKIAAK